MPLLSFSLFSYLLSSTPHLINCVTSQPAGLSCRSPPPPPSDSSQPRLLPEAGGWSWIPVRPCLGVPLVLSEKWGQGHQQSQHLLRVPGALDNMQLLAEAALPWPFCWQLWRTSLVVRTAHPEIPRAETAAIRENPELMRDGSHDFCLVGKKRTHSSWH